MNADTLQAMTRPELQRLARARHVKANLKSIEIIKQLLEQYPDGVPPPVLEHVDNTDASLPLPQAALQSPDRAPSDAQRVAPLTNSIRLPPIIPPNDGGVAPHQNTSRGPSTGRLPSISNLTRFNTPGPLHNALSRENTFQSLATPQPGPPMSRSPPNSLHRFPPTTPQAHPRATSTSSVASGQPEEDIEGPAEPASLKMLERAVRGMDNLLANHEDYYNAIVKQRDLVRHARIRAQNARLLVLQEKSIHQRLSNYLSYFRPCSDSWTNRDVYGSKCRAKQLADGTYEEVDSDDEQREAEEKELFARAPTLREDGDGPVEQTTVEEIPIIEVPAYEAYNIQLSPTPGLSRRKRARSSSAEACSPSPRSPKRTRVGSSRSNASLSHNSGSQRANSHGTSGSHRGSNQGDEEYVVSMLESGSGESSHSQNSTRRRNARVEEVRVNHGSDGFLGGMRSSSVSHHANFESSSPGVGRSAPTPLSNGNPNGMIMDLGLTMDRVWYENPKDSDVDNAPPMPQFKERNYSVKGKQRAKA